MTLSVPVARKMLRLNRVALARSKEKAGDGGEGGPTISAIFQEPLPRACIPTFTLRCKHVIVIRNDGERPEALCV
jgi:hypothetical protein